MNISPAQIIGAVFFIATYVGAVWLLRRAIAAEKKKRMPPLLYVHYRVPDGVNIGVTACGCPRCRNVVWAQRVAIEPPKFCAYCGLQYVGKEIADDAEMEARGMIVPD